MGGKFAAEDRQDLDPLPAGLLDQRIPAGEVPFARLRLHLRPVEVGTDETDAGPGDARKLLLHLLRRHPVQMGADAVRGFRRGQCQRGGGQQTGKELPFHRALNSN